MNNNEIYCEDMANYFPGQSNGVDENIIPRDCFKIDQMQSVNKKLKVDIRQNGTSGSCYLCGKIVTNLKKHLKSHNPEQHKCPLCPIVLTRADNLKRHLRMKHCSVLGITNSHNIQI